MSFRAASIKCQACGKTVYAMEAMQADGKTFHKGCMKCAECNGVLKLGNYAAVGGKYYCKPHFKQLFKLKGNYSSGFGEEKDNKSHSFAVPTGRADFNKAAPRPGSSPSTPLKTSAGSPAASPAPAEKEHPATLAPATTPAPKTTVPQLASPTPTRAGLATTTTTSAPPRGLGASGGGSFENDKKALEAEKRAFEEEKRRFEEEKRKKEAELKAASGAAEKELAAAKEAAAAAAAAPAPEPTPAPAPVTLSASEILICDAFCALIQDGVKKELALRKVGLAK